MDSPSWCWMVMAVAAAEIVRGVVLCLGEQIEDIHSASTVKYFISWLDSPHLPKATSQGPRRWSVMVEIATHTRLRPHHSRIIVA